MQCKLWLCCQATSCTGKPLMKKKVQDVNIICHVGVLYTKNNSAPVLHSSCSQQYQVLLDEVVSLCQLFVSVL